MNPELKGGKDWLCTCLGEHYSRQMEEQVKSPGHESIPRNPRNNQAAGMAEGDSVVREKIEVRADT